MRARLPGRRCQCREPVLRVSVEEGRVAVGDVDVVAIEVVRRSWVLQAWQTGARAQPCSWQRSITLAGASWQTAHLHPDTLSDPGFLLSVE